MNNCDLLLWKNPVETGKVFGALLVSLLVLKKVNLITFFLRVSYSILFLSSSVEFVSRFVLGQGLVTKYGVQDCPNLVAKLRPKMEALLVHLPAFQAQFRRLVMAASPQQTFKTAGVLYIAHKLVSFFSLWTLTLLAVIGTFTLPVVYRMYQREIDEAVHQGVVMAKAKSAEVQKLASETAAPYIKQLEEKVGPISHYFAPKSAPGSAQAAPSVASSKGSAAEPAVGTSSSASFPSVPSTKVPAATKEVDHEEIDIEQLKQEMKDHKETAGL